MTSNRRHFSVPGFKTRPSRSPVVGWSRSTTENTLSQKFPPVTNWLFRDDQIPNLPEQFPRRRTGDQQSTASETATWAPKGVEASRDAFFLTLPSGWQWHYPIKKSSPGVLLPQFLQVEIMPQLETLRRAALRW